MLQQQLREGYRASPVNLIMLEMIQKSISARSIEFFARIYPDISSTDLTCAKMSSLYGCTPQAGIKHVKNLEEHGYLKRKHYRAWGLSEQILKYIENIHKGQIYVFKYESEPAVASAESAYRQN